MSVRRSALPAWAAAFALVLAGASGLGLAAAPLAHADPSSTVSAVNDTALTTPGQAVTVNPLTNDSTTGGDPSDQLDPTSVSFGPDGQPQGATPAGDGKSMDVANEGSYTIASDGSITFTPVDGFDAVATPVQYTVLATDGTSGTATLTVTVHTTPTAADDAADVTGYYVFHVLDNDTSDAGAPFQPSTLQFSSDQDPQLQLYGGNFAETANGGSYQLGGDGTIRYSSGGSARGPDTPLRYQVSDADGRTATAVIRPTNFSDGSFGPSPYQTLVDGIPTSVDVLSDVYYYDGQRPDPSRLTFSADGQQPGTERSDDGRSLSLPGQWTLTIDPTSGAITALGADPFSGYAQVSLTLTGDYAKTLTTSWYLPFARAYAAVDDTADTSSVRAVTIRAIDNDSFDFQNEPNSQSLVFPTDGQPEDAVRADDGKTLTVPGEGTYVIDGYGQITFTPQHGSDGPAFLGTTTPVTYSATTYLQQSSSAHLTVDVHAPLTVPDQTTSVRYGQQVWMDLSEPIRDGDDSYFDYYFGTLRFADAQQVGTLSDDKRTLVVPGEGTWTAQYGSAQFVPVTGFSGTTTPVTYAVDTIDGTATAKLTATIGQPPRAVDDTATTRAGTSVSVSVLANDTSDPASQLWPWTLAFASDGQPDGAVLSYNTLTVPNQGQYTINGANVSFTPASGFTGPTTPVLYTVRDSDYNLATGALTITVTQHPSATADTASTSSGQAVRIPVLANDSSDPSTSLDPSTVQLLAGDAQGASLSSNGLTLTTAQGSYQVDTATGDITFTPADGFSGTTDTVAYAVADRGGDVATSAVTVLVRRAVASADDSASTGSGRPVRIHTLANDSSDPSTSLDPSTVQLLAGDAHGASLSSDGRTLTTAQGSYQVDGVTGDITFAPVDGFSGTTDPVTYSVADLTGATGRASVTVTVAQPVTVANDAASTAFGHAVQVPVLANDSADPSTSLDPTSLRLLGDDHQGSSLGQDGRTLTTVQGSYQVDATHGAISFTPATGFSGVTTGVRYAVDDRLGATGQGVLTITVRRTVTAVDDAASTILTTPVTLAVLGNDSNDPSPLDATSVVFVAPTDQSGTVSGNGRTLTTKQGTYVAGSDGRVKFTAAKGFAGATTPVRYQVSNTVGDLGGALIRITVLDQITAQPDKPALAWGVASPVNLLGNDSALTKLLPGSVVFTAGSQPAGSKLASGNRVLTVPNQATYVINASTGVVTVTPVKSVSGKVLSTVRYSVQDTSGASSAAGLLTVTVKPAPGLAGVADAATTKIGKVVTVAVLGNDHASPGAKFSASSVQLTGATSKAVRTALANGGKKLVVAGQGTYVVNPSGSITFTPAAKYIGKATPVAYRVTDGNGLTVTSMLTITVTK